jgi:maltooligosyltrehalose synthase
VAFSRQYQNIYLLVVVPRLNANLLSESSTPHIRASRWGDTHLVLPPELNPSSHILVDSLAPITNRAVQEPFYIRDVLANFPVNFLIFETTFPSSI